MSSLVDRIFAEVCLDERISDGIFRMDEEQHMDALRDYFIKKGIAQEDAVAVTNRMVEGKYPDRQAWRVEDGILVTWPSPKHKHKAMQENPGKYTDQKPAIVKKAEAERQPETPEETEPTDDTKPTEEPPEKEEEPTGGGGGGGGSNLFGQTVKQGGQELEVEPIGGAPEEPPKAPAEEQPPRTPERIAAEKEVVKQIVGAKNDNALANFEPQLNETCRQQLTELFKHADKMGYDEAVRFLIKYVKL